VLFEISTLNTLSRACCFDFHTVLPEPISNQSNEQQAIVGGNVSIQCPLRFGSLQNSYEVIWNVDGRRITNGSHGYLIQTYPNKSLIISNVTLDHGGLFQCNATLFNFFPVISPLVQLIPYRKLIIHAINFLSAEPPIILSISPVNSVVVANGAHVQVSCNMSGAQRLDIEWCVSERCNSTWVSDERYIVSIAKSSQDNHTIYSSIFQITSAREEDSGPITCRITSNKNIYMTTELFVLCKQ